jgi:hypothetical protein
MEIDVLKFKVLYKNLLDSIQNKSRKDLCLFFPQVGKNYFDIDDKILFIGKSVNGWITNILDIDILFDDKNDERIINRDDQIIWVKDNKNKDYNSNNSAFWRLIKNISKKYLKKDDWYNNIAWTNLYKISPWKGGNPSTGLKKLQSKICVEILTKEIDYFNPKYIIYLTSGWEDFYLRQIEYDISKNVIVKWDKYKTKYQKFDNRYFVLSQHPQGKKENPHIKAIIDILENSK